MKCPVCDNELDEYAYFDDGPYGRQMEECGIECNNCGYCKGEGYGHSYEKFPYPSVLLPLMSDDFAAFERLMEGDAENE